MGRRTRAALAVLLTLVLTGLGHAYLRRWRRAVGWFLATLSAGFALLTLFPPEITAEMSSMPIADLTRTVVEALPPEVTLPIAALRFLAAADAYRIAAYAPARQRGDDGPTCPNCRGELDEGLDFCPWCAEPLTRRARDDREEPERTVEH